MGVNVKIWVFWDAALGSLKMDTAGSSETVLPNSIKSKNTVISVVVNTFT
jgi:hypothetical protein